MQQDQTAQPFTIIKQNPQGNEQIRYSGVLCERLENGVIIQAFWTLPARDLEYVRFEPGDLFIEYYYADRWFNVFAIYSRDRTHKGWYCNITEPARFQDERIEQIDLLLDVWIDPTGRLLILDEEEFAAATTMSERQRQGAQAGLRRLLTLVENHEEMFSCLAD